MSLTTKLSAIKKKLQALNAAFFQGNQTQANSSHTQTMEILFDAIADGVMVFNKEKTIVMANHAAARFACWELTDLSREELKKNYHFFKEDATTPLPVEEEPLEVALATREPCEMEGYITSEKLPQKGAWVRAHAAPILDDHGESVGAVTVFHEITERKRLERQRDCLVTLIAHDLKNHLAAESTFFRMLSAMMNETDDAFRALVSDLKYGNARFLTMCDSLMEMSRAKFFASADHGSAIALSAVLNDAIESNRLALQTSGVSVNMEVAEGAYVWGLPHVVWQVFHNIILNAVQASADGSSINIVVHRNAVGPLEVDDAYDQIAAEPPFWCTSISDTGEGMTPDEVAVLFDSKRVAGHKHMTSYSTGFGLYLSAMLIESQNGSISCRSKKNLGTTIDVVLPAAINSG